jgi:hypothetical protein
MLFSFRSQEYSLTHNFVLWLKKQHTFKREARQGAPQKKRVKASLALVEVDFKEQRRIAQLIS